MQLQLVSFLADYDDDGIKDDVDNCTNIPNLSQFDGNSDGTGDACDALPPPAPTNLAVNGTGTQVTGKAQPESTVKIYAPGGAQIGTATTDSSGNFTANISPAQVNGQVLSVTATDSAGESPASPVTAPDTIPPNAPLNAQINGAGTIVTGQAQVGSTVEVRNSAGTLLGSQIVPASGNFSVTLSPAQTDGQILTVTAKDLGGTSPPVTLTAPDLAPPAPPTGLAVNTTGTVVTGNAEPNSAIVVKAPNGAIIGTGTSNAAGAFSVSISPAQVNGELLSVTAADVGGVSAPATVNAPDTIAPAAPQNVVINGAGNVVTGQAQPNSTVEVRDPAGTLIGSAVVPANGNFSVTLNPAQTNGEVLAVTAKDAGGTSPVVNVTAPDLAAPAAPSNLQVNATGTVVTGNAQANSTVVVKDPNGATIGTATATVNGSFSVSISPAQIDGELLSVTAEDGGGVSAPATVTAPDLNPPDAPTGLAVNQAGTVVTGEAEPNSSIVVKDPSGTTIGTGNADANGDFAITISPAQTNGQLLSVTASDVGGVSPAATVLAPDSDTPNSPTNLQVNPTGTQMTGNAQAGSLVIIKDPAGNTIGSGQAAGDGTFTLVLMPAQTNGELLSVTSSDNGGTSLPATVNAPDLVAPTVPLNVVINALGTVVSGEAQPGSTVEVRDPSNTIIGTVIVPNDGNFAVTLNPAQTNGEVLAVTAKDLGGTSPVVNVTAPDLTPPDSPQNVAVNNTGTVVTGEAQPGSTVQVRDPAGSLIGSATAGADGSFTVPISPAQTNGEMLSVTATDAGGSSAPVQVAAPDSTPPAAPLNVTINGQGTIVSGSAEPNSTVEVRDPANNVIGSAIVPASGNFNVTLNPAQTNAEVLTVTAADAGGASPAVNVTAPDLTPPNAPQNPVVNSTGTAVTGQAQPSSLVEVRAPNGDLLGSATTAADGTFNVPISPAQIDGETLDVTATDAGGTSAPAQVTAPDTTAPSAPTGLAVSPDGTTVTGKTEPGATVEVKDPAGNTIGTGTADGNGDFSVTISPAQTDGQVLEVTATDGGGTSAPAQVTAPDNTAPGAPTGLAVSPDGTTVTGKTEPGATVEVKDPAGNTIGTGTADGNGDFSVTISPAQTDGQVLEVTATDGGGTSAPAQVTAPDNTAPSAPTGLAVSPDGTTVTGKTEPGATVEVKDPAGNTIGTGTADGNGDFSVTISPAQTDGQVLEVTATDGGGTSAPAQVTAPDTTPPAAPQQVVVAPDGGSVSGKAQPGSTVTVTDPAGNVIGSGTTDGNGDFNVPIAPAQTNGQILDVVATDAAGNPSAPTQAQAPVLSVPAAPTDLAVGANGASVTGKAEPNASITVRDASGTVLGTANADASGNFYVAISPAQTQGQVLSVTAANASGTSPAASVTAPILDDELEAGVLMRHWGEMAKGKFGYAVAAGDIDGDGHLDVVVGAPSYSRVIPGTTKKVKQVGRVYAYSGRTGQLLLTLDGEVKGDWFGHSVAVLDFNGDGQLDIAVGAPRAKPSPALKQSGKVYVYSGADGSLLATALGGARGEQLGTTMLSLSHETDTHLLAVGAPRAKSAAGFAAAGYVSVLRFDAASSSKATEAYRIEGIGKQERLGTVLAAAPDLSADGYSELAVGLPKLASSTGKFGVVRIYSTELTSANSRLLATIDGGLLPANTAGAPRNGDLFGSSIATVDDMDGDGIDELLIGVPGFDPIRGGKRVNNAGAAFVAAGSMLNTSTAQANWLASYYGEAKKDQFGWAVANGGALQAGGDSYHFIAAKAVDVIVNNPKNGKPMKANDAGALYGYKAGATERSFKRTGNAKKGYYGNILLAVGDVDKDGYTDVITASPFMSRYSPLTRKWLRNIGFVEVYSGEFIVNRPTP